MCAAAAREAVQARGLNNEPYRGNMYEYAKSVREVMEDTYKYIPQSGYINLWNDDQIRETVLKAEEYFKTNS